MMMMMMIIILRCPPHFLISNKLWSLGYPSDSLGTPRGYLFLAPDLPPIQGISGTSLGPHWGIPETYLGYHFPMSPIITSFSETDKIRPLGVSHCIDQKRY